MDVKHAYMRCVGAISAEQFHLFLPLRHFLFPPTPALLLRWKNGTSLICGSLLKDSALSFMDIRKSPALRMQRCVQDTTSGYCLCCHHPNPNWKRLHPHWDQYPAQHRHNPGGLLAEQRRAWGEGWPSYTGTNFPEISQIARRRSLLVFCYGSFR